MNTNNSIDFEKQIDTADDDDPREPTEEEIEDEIQKEIERVDLENEKEDEDENENSDWDGSESEFVEDDDAKEYEEKYSGIKISYNLRKEEVISCIRHCGVTKQTTKYGSIFLGFLTAIYLVLFLLKSNSINLFLLMISLILFILWVSKILPVWFERLSFEKVNANKLLHVEIFPDCITVDDGQCENEILLNGTNSFEEFNNLYFIFLENRKIFIIPKRAIEPDVLPDVEAMLIAGTTPKGDNE